MQSLQYGVVIPWTTHRTPAGPEPQGAQPQPAVRRVRAPAREAVGDARSTARRVPGEECVAQARRADGAGTWAVSGGVARREACALAGRRQSRAAVGARAVRCTAQVPWEGDAAGALPQRERLRWLRACAGDVSMCDTWWYASVLTSRTAGSTTLFKSSAWNSA